MNLATGKEIAHRGTTTKANRIGAQKETKSCNHQEEDCEVANADWQECSSTSEASFCTFKSVMHPLFLYLAQAHLNHLCLILFSRPKGRGSQTIFKLLAPWKGLDVPTVARCCGIPGGGTSTIGVLRSPWIRYGSALKSPHPFTAAVPSDPGGSNTRFFQR